MTITVPDNVLKEADLTEQQLLTEFACHLFDAEVIALWPAAQMAGLTRVEFENELRKRDIAIYRITPEYWQMELDTLKALETQ